MRTHRGSLCAGERRLPGAPRRPGSGVLVARCQLLPEAPPAWPARPPTALLGAAICSPGRLGKGRGWAERLPFEPGSTPPTQLTWPKVGTPLHASLGGDAGPAGVLGTDPCPGPGPAAFPGAFHGALPHALQTEPARPPAGPAGRVLGIQEPLPGRTPLPQSHTLTLVGVGGGQDGAVLPLHLLHVLRDLVDEAADLLHLCTGASSGDPGGRSGAPGLDQTGAGGQVQRGWTRLRGGGVCDVGPPASKVSQRIRGRGVCWRPPVRRTHP